MAKVSAILTPLRPMRVVGKVVLGLVAMIVPVFATAGMPVQARGGRQMVEDRFAAAAPAVGDPAPDVKVFDADGKAHQLRAILKGNYSVLVMGCLT